jgi:hypothetical protein
MHINIPAKPNYDNLELSDEQLEVVAGGEVAAAVGIFLGGAAVGVALVALWNDVHR